MKIIWKNWKNLRPHYILLIPLIFAAWGMKKIGDGGESLWAWLWDKIDK